MAVGDAIFCGVFFRDNCQPEVAIGVIYDLQVWMDIRMKLDDSRAAHFLMHQRWTNNDNGYGNKQTRSPPIGGARKNAASLNFAVSAECREIHCVIAGDLGSNRDRNMPAAPVLRIFVQYLIAFCSRLETAIVTSYPIGLCGRLSTIRL